MRKKNYIVRPDERLVLATMDRVHECDSVIDEVCKRCSKNTFAVVHNLITGGMDTNKDLDIYIGDDIPPFIGIASCDSKDKFEVRIGMDIAGCKVDMKYHQAMAKKYDIIMKILVKTITELQSLYDMHINKANRIEKDLNEHYCGKQL